MVKRKFTLEQNQEMRDMYNLRYENYNARQRINPETGEKFKSQTDYRNYRIIQRINSKTLDSIVEEVEGEE